MLCKFASLLFQKGSHLAYNSFDRDVDLFILIRVIVYLCYIVSIIFA